jgi:competence protein ComEA
MRAVFRWPLLRVQPLVLAARMALVLGWLIGSTLGPWPAAAQALPNASSAFTIDLNQATRAEIESVRAVGVELTERLLQARQLAPFTDWQDLRRRVKGVSRKALQGFAEAGFEIRGQPPAFPP